MNTHHVFQQKYYALSCVYNKYNIHIKNVLYEYYDTHQVGNIPYTY